MRWVDDTSDVITPLQPSIEDGLEVGDWVSFPVDRYAYGFGWVVRMFKGGVVIEANSYPSRQILVERRRVVKQEGGDCEEVDGYDGGGVEIGADANSGGASGERKSYEKEGEHEEDQQSHPRIKAADHRVIIEL